MLASADLRTEFPECPPVKMIVTSLQSRLRSAARWLRPRSSRHY